LDNRPSEASPVAHLHPVRKVYPTRIDQGTVIRERAGGCQLKGVNMISGEKVLVTGASGTLGGVLGRFLAQSNEVWGMARLTDEASREKVKAAGMSPVALDFERPDFTDVPQDFTYVLHLAHTRRGADEFVEAIQINAVGPGLLLQHCRKAKAALVVSSTAVYSPPADVFHPLREDEGIGRSFTPWAPSSPVSKVSLEAVARLASEAFSLPTTIVRLNTTYGLLRGTGSGMPCMDLANVIAGNPVRSFADPYPHSPIHYDDMCDQLEALLGAASVQANIVNWCGDEVITQRQWCDMAARFSGKPAELIVNLIPGTPNGNAGDTTRRMAITGPCKRAFEPSFRAIFDAMQSEAGA
jgi:UDP-glucuronate 4-epimerase